MISEPSDSFDFVSSKIIALLERISGSSNLAERLDINLLDEGLLDSLGFVELIVGISEEFGINLAPSEVDRNNWATPSQIIAFVRARAMEIA